MAQRIEVTLVDDVDGTEAAGTVEFALDGSAYEIDLSATNAAKLRQALEPWTAKARKIKAAKASTTRRSSTSSAGLDLAAVRAWASANGYEVSSRGRIPREVQQAYLAAHP